MDEEASEPGLGCGVIIDPSGIVLTNCHVVEDAEEMLVELPDGRLFKVKDVRKDEKSDLAVLSVDCTEPLPATRLGDSEALRIGDWVLTIGSPFELEQTVSAGIISAKGRSVRGAGKTQLLQTDAAINPGSSGGALVNLRGEVVGITTAIASRDGGYQGVGFAIPINLAKWVSAQLREYGRVRRGYLGITTTRRSGNVTDSARTLRGGVSPAPTATSNLTTPESAPSAERTGKSSMSRSFLGEPATAAADRWAGTASTPPAGTRPRRKCRSTPFARTAFITPSMAASTIPP